MSEATNILKLESHVLEILKEAKNRFFDTQLNQFKSLNLKGLNQLVTNTDLATEAFLVEQLSKILPNSSFVVEEDTASRISSAPYEWIIDPLDGTTNYVHQIPVYSISIGLTEKGKPIAGFVYELNRDELFYATSESEAYCNGDIISVNTERQLADSLIATGFPYFDFDGLDNYLDVLQFAMKNTRGVRRLGSAAVDLAYVACGRFDAFFEYGLNAWDVAGGAYIVERAGGKVSDFGEGDDFIFGKQILASTEELHATFIKELSKMK
jgi:myo-inositol-1(or 4)-monophosphatase